MRKFFIVAGLVGAAGVMGAGVAMADDAVSDSSQTIVVPPADGDGSTVIVSSSVSNTAGNLSCVPADVAARFPFLPGPVC